MGRFTSPTHQIGASAAWTSKANSVTTLAGRGNYGHRDGLGEVAEFRDVDGLVHHEDKLYVSDIGSHCLRCVEISTRELLLTCVRVK